MGLFFTDHLEVTNGSGTYTLQGFADGTWNDIQTITGPTTGTITVDAVQHLIPVDIQHIHPGETYDFRWVDTDGRISNIRTITIPTATLTKYAFGTSEINFTNNGGDNWTVSVPFAFNNLYASGTLTSMNVYGTIYQNGTDVMPGIYFAEQGKTSDVNHNITGVGAGVYFFLVQYLFDDGVGTGMCHIAEVDDSGNIIKSVSMKGYHVTSVTDLKISLTALYSVTGSVNIVSSNVICSDDNISNELSANNVVVDAYLMPFATDLTFLIQLDSSEWPDIVGVPSYQFYINSHYCVITDSTLHFE